MTDKLNKNIEIDKKSKVNPKIIILAGIIILGFVAIIALFANGLDKNSQKLQLATKNQKIIEFNLPDLLSDKFITLSELKSSKPYYLVNFWGSWCPACYQEHNFLLELSKKETIYGINWKDKKQDALAMMNDYGNPFTRIIVDDDSILAIGMGVYGAPETFLVKADGTILHRYAGPMDNKIWEDEFVPIIKEIE